ncbi:MAG: cupin domain-containing protein [Sedimentisphaerales bacterium]|nr:cupin domain-containing protein [Sedimentisphaerales bacterium]
MLIKHLKDCIEFIAGDGCTLRELLHPAKAELEIRYSLAHAKVPAGQKTTPHKLGTSEVYYILSGTGLMHIGREVQNVKQHCALYIPPGSTQYIENTGISDLEFLCIVDPAWKKSDEIVLGN